MNCEEEEHDPSGGIHTITSDLGSRALLAATLTYSQWTALTSGLSSIFGLNTTLILQLFLAFAPGFASVSGLLPVIGLGTALTFHLLSTLGTALTPGLMLTSVLSPPRTVFMGAVLRVCFLRILLASTIEF